jgi:GrpB-like predicted nucleotidyltransferase (UPF0157 family)
MTVTLVEKYNPAWPRWFEEIKTSLGEKVSKVCRRIEHVGSTAIPGMTAKPIIDIIIVIEPKRWGEMKSLLEERGYRYQGDQGIPEREVFRLNEDRVKSAPPFHHLYVCPENSLELKKETAFRDYLKKNQIDAKRLSELKWALAKKYNNDKYPYMDGKAALCGEITRKALAYQKKARKRIYRTYLTLRYPNSR